MGTGLVSDLLATGLARHEALRAAIKAKGIRQFAVAQRVGVSEGELSRMLSGRRVITDELAQSLTTAIEELVA